MFTDLYTNAKNKKYFLYDDSFINSKSYYKFVNKRKEDLKTYLDRIFGEQSSYENAVLCYFSNY